MSHDLEDVVCVLDGRPELEDEVADATREIRNYVCARVRDFMDNPQFIESLPGHLPGRCRQPSEITHAHRKAAQACGI